MEEAKCTLGEIMDEQGPFTEEESACYFVQLMNGIEGIHRCASDQYANAFVEPCASKTWTETRSG